MLAERFAAEEFEQELEQRHRSLRSTGEDDDEALLNLLRRAHHAEVFRILARDVEGRLPKPTEACRAFGLRRTEMRSR